MFLYEHQNHLLHLPILYTSPFHPGVQRNQPETKHRSSISDQHQYKRLGLTDSPSEEERPPLEQEEIPPVGTQVWFPPRQHPNKTFFEFCNHPHQECSTIGEISLFHPPAEARQSSRIPISRIIPNNIYGDRPSIQIKKDLQGLAPVQKESMNVKPTHTNEDDDIEQMYSSKWICHHLFMAVESTNNPLPK